jgi:hypothetical protein
MMAVHLSPFLWLFLLLREEAVEEVRKVQLGVAALLQVQNCLGHPLGASPD